MIVAHRGYAARFPENTIEACEGAVRAGCRWIEVDVQLLDGAPVLAHDTPAGGETALEEFAAWLDTRPGVTALVEIKKDSLKKFGREPVVSACMAAMRGVWHPISFDYEALALAVAAGSRAPGWVVCRFGAEVQRAARELGARWLITNRTFMPAKLPSGPWEWMVYEIANRAQAEDARRRGAQWLETMAVGELIAELEE